MKFIKIGYLFFFLTLAYTSCRKPYEPPVTTINSNLLVVEGLINTGKDSTIIKLSRTVPISEKGTVKPELRAQVVVESEQNVTYPLREIKAGVYGAASLNLDPNQKYRININTADGTVYQSDFVESKVSPPIDSISWEAKNDGLQIYSNTHDDSKKSVYYRWEYDEAWEFSAQYRSLFIAEPDGLNVRNQETQNIYNCWGTNNDGRIVLGSSVKLEKDIIYNNPITFIRSDSEKVMRKYSILVRQYVLTKEAFDYWETLRRNTESLGSIFDAQPSQLTGNIKNIGNPNEPVLGYISAGTVQQQRIFVAVAELPKWKTKYPYSCTADTVRNDDFRPEALNEKEYWEEWLNMVPLEPAINKESVRVGTMGATKECADCTIRGTNKRPEYWQ